MLPSGRNEIWIVVWDHTMSYGGSILWDMAMHFALHIRLHNFASCNFRGKQRKLIAIRPTCFSESRAIAFDRYTLFQPSTFYFNTIFKHIFFVSFDHIGLLSHFYITNIWWLRNPAPPKGWLKPYTIIMGCLPSTNWCRISLANPP